MQLGLLVGYGSWHCDAMEIDWDNIDWEAAEILRINPVTGRQVVHRLWPEVHTSLSDHLVTGYLGALTVLVLQVLLRVLLSPARPAIPADFELLWPSLSAVSLA